MSLRAVVVHKFSKNINRVRIVLRVVVDWLLFRLTRRKLTDISKPGHVTYLFLGHDLQPHFPRMVKWICRNIAMHPVLLVGDHGNFTLYNTDQFDQVFTYRSIWQLRRRLRDLHGYDVIYASGAVAWPVRTAIEQASTPVLFDVKDTYIVNFGFNPPQLYMRLDLKNERFALEHASGIISESIEAYFAYETYEISKRPPALFFPLYCDDDHLASRSSPEDNEEIHIVYVGGFYGSTADKRQFGNEIHFDLSDTLAEQHIHLHLYPSPAMKRQVIAEYEKHALSNTYLHIHTPVNQAQLAEEISQYHYGLIPFFNRLTQRLPTKAERSTALKVFNYMEAGLPILISNDCVFEKWIAGRYGCAIGIDEPDLGRLHERLGDLNYSDLRTQARVRRERGLLSKQITRHIDFTKKIISAPANPKSKKLV